jgi:hypothetical protein
MNETTEISLRPQIRADILHIGYPKAASTFLVKFLARHPGITLDQFQLSDLLRSSSAFTLAEKPCANKIHISKDENIAEAVCVVGRRTNWQRYLYVPGGWDLVKKDVVIDPREAASRVHKVHSDAKILIVIREQADWLQSVYKFVISQLPWNRRSFADYCTTPSAIALLQSGHYDQTVSAYIDLFGSHRVAVLRFEDIVMAPSRFTAQLFNFIGVPEQQLPEHRENESHAQIARILRVFPVVERLPRSVKDTLKQHAMCLIPGARGTILSSRDIRMIRGMYAASNQRTEKLIRQLSM